jgi:hypothetical protein
VLRLSDDEVDEVRAIRAEARRSAKEGKGAPHAGKGGALFHPSMADGPAEERSIGGGLKFDLHSAPPAHRTGPLGVAAALTAAVTKHVVAQEDYHRGYMANTNTDPLAWESANPPPSPPTSFATASPQAAGAGAGSHQPVDDSPSAGPKQPTVIQELPSAGTKVVEQVGSANSNGAKERKESKAGKGSVAGTNAEARSGVGAASANGKHRKNHGASSPLPALPHQFHCPFRFRIFRGATAFAAARPCLHSIQNHARTNTHTYTSS